ncbi:hypothetical protein Bbelb_200900 [Branchiostoma belcheri]|nr:hypothetical protein Bbelb_200900 [Branchiostoma belcheri]
MGSVTREVFVNGKVSSWQLLTSGVPQGGVLSPYLFLLYMSSRSTVYNDTLDVAQGLAQDRLRWREVVRLRTEEEDVGYADDVGLSRSIPCRSCGTDNTMSADALQLDTWAGQNDTVLNGKRVSSCRSASLDARYDQGAVIKAPWYDRARKGVLLSHPPEFQPTGDRTRNTPARTLQHTRASPLKD